jgi:hypothetical protein
VSTSPLSTSIASSMTPARVRSRPGDLHGVHRGLARLVQRRERGRRIVLQEARGGEQAPRVLVARIGLRGRVGQ